MGVEIFTSILFRVSALSEPLLFDFGVCFCSLLQAFAHAFDFGHESMEISTTHVVYSICLFDSVKEGICPLFHGHCLCFEHFEFVQTVAFCLLAIIEPLALFTSITSVITLLRAILRSGASSRSS